MPRLTEDHLTELGTKKFIIIPDFLSSTQLADLRHDVLELRNTHKKFKVAKIGQDATNELNTNIRVAETCFIGPTKTEQDLPSSSSTLSNPAARNDLYQILDQIRVDLCGSSSSLSRKRTLDAGLTELLYAYYPKGGYYRRHVDSVAKSASVLRSISLLLYLNPADWNMQNDGGQLRIHLDSSKDELPLGQEPNYIDVEPRGGTLVLFESNAIPHEVLDTNRERMAVVGWYNRPVSLTDIADLAQGATGVGLASGNGAGGSGDMQKTTVMLAVAAALVTVGVVQLLT
jgi:SM-20-related protein